MEIPLSEIDKAVGNTRRNEVLWKNGNVGRWLGIARGKGDYEGKLFMSYVFGGRSSGSKFRMAVQEGTAIRLVAPGQTAEEMAQKSDAPLVFYHSSNTRAGVFVVSNGAQTNYVLDAMVDGASFKDAVSKAPVKRGMIDGEEKDIDLSSYEPDRLHTPRISGFVDLREGASTSLGLAVVRKTYDGDDPGDPIRTYYTGSIDDLAPGEGWAIQTYGVNDPNDPDAVVPSFDQEPYPYNVQASPAETAGRLRNAIGERIFAAAVVRVIDIGTGQFDGSAIINTNG
jgi:IMP cyclohydrolase